MDAYMFCVAYLLYCFGNARGRQTGIYFKAADLCWIPCEKYIVQVKERIEYLKNHISSVEENVIIVEESKQLIEEFGLDTWNKLASQSRKYLITAMFCYEQLDGLSGMSKQQIDFSATILPMMKALELELKKCFYVKYINFLKEEFATPEVYLLSIPNRVKSLPWAVFDFVWASLIFTKQMELIVTVRQFNLQKISYWI